MTLLLVTAGLLIAGCMVFLVFQGVSLRTATLIRPSVVPDDAALARAVAMRLFAEWKDHELVLVAEPGGDWSRRVATELQRAVTEVSRKALSVANTATDPSSCPDLCWLEAPSAEVLDLAPGMLLTQRVRPTGRPYLTLHLIEFEDFERDIVADCEREKRLDFRCLKTLAIRESRRRMKDPDARYFFLRKYNHRDYFLFLQTSPARRLLQEP
jgi:hypothetical protein